MRCTPTDTSLLEKLPPRVCVCERPITTAKGRARLLERRRTRRGRRTPGSGVARRELGELESHVPKRRPVVKSHAPIGEPSCRSAVTPPIGTTGHVVTDVRD
ncbi:lipopolysaccharide biosynthesis protein [Anopheles sinensis]|uniref:Lipopolysaccharide biosynthesis protein n=1 Tax=Anopheles sinensis TaxID=74873 RepID=A0A084W590_ANOSI|nr:lipopolysaccharide biosynthesis protein [Anopheles sinensis]